MQVVVWIIIILVVIFLIWLLRRWIRRVIFILILLALAFFIYGIFSPSWAARLWYNVRTFPQRVSSWISSGSEFLDYNTYKLKISSIWDEIWDKIWEKVSLGDDEIDLDLTDNIDINVESSEKEEEYMNKNIEEDEDSQLEERQTIKAFPKSVNFVDLPALKEKYNQKSESENFGILTWYSKSDLIWVINKYIEKNLDDDTDILVTVEYEDDSADPQKIILQTQSRSASDVYQAQSSNSLLNDLFKEN